jgi:hypothetical protein
MVTTANDCGFGKRKAILEVVGDTYALTTKDAAGPIILRGKVDRNSQISTYIIWKINSSSAGHIFGNGKFIGVIKNKVFMGNLYSFLDDNSGSEIPSNCIESVYLEKLQTITLLLKTGMVSWILVVLARAGWPWGSRPTLPNILTSHTQLPPALKKNIKNNAQSVRQNISNSGSAKILDHDISKTKVKKSPQSAVKTAAQSRNYVLAYFYARALIYKDDVGVLQGFETAYMWFNIAAANGNRDAVKERNDLINMLSKSSIESGQKRAKRCTLSDYSDCD